VRQKYSSNLHHIHLSYFLQSLTTFILAFNKIGDTGVHYLGEALRNNTVRHKHSSFLSYIYLFFNLIQILTTLNVRNNQIGSAGAQYLAEGLKKNTVR
jgi:hypothetical protein